MWSFRALGCRATSTLHLAELETTHLNGAPDMLLRAVQNLHVGDCQNYGPFLGPYYNTGPNTGPSLGDPKRDHNFDSPPRSI